MAIDLLVWWYGAGFKSLLERIQLILAKTIDMFSVDLLFRTLFSPFRQIDAGGARGPIGLILRTWFDNLFSRFVGFIVRTFTIVLGILAALVMGVFGALWAIGWLLVPILPFIGIFFAIWGVGL